MRPDKTAIPASPASTPQAPAVVEPVECMPLDVPPGTAIEVLDTKATDPAQQYRIKEN
ncbi:hypothetical protein [Micromonospora sp. S4605]|uniref:hypothetical protein n=1 Tax=Micromonospora sp. S4605 TaxID=1420897 RepID=UPI001305302A|nr:hypothetical protein [Micromonospora sp. S4605]